MFNDSSVLSFDLNISELTKEKIRADAQELCTSHLASKVWRTSDPHQLTGIQLTPLSRYKTEDGRSGADFFVCHFYHGNSKSYPLFLKVGKDESSVKRINQELENYRKIEEHIPRDGFVTLLDYKKGKSFKKDSTYSSVWSMYKQELTGDLNSEGALYQLIEKKKYFEAIETLKATYMALRKFHKAGKNTIEKLNIVKQYEYYYNRKERYSRKTFYSKPGPGKKDFDVHPLEFFEELLRHSSRYNFRLCVGNTHGDLHPRNVLFNSISRALLIDYGWSDDNRHILVDCILMELSIVLFYISPDIPLKDILILNKKIIYDNNLPNKTKIDHINGYLDIIRVVREYASEYVCSDWTREYKLPMFLVLMGLHSFIDQFVNPTAGKDLAAHLAKHLSADL